MRHVGEVPRADTGDETPGHVLGGAALKGHPFLKVIRQLVDPHTKDDLTATPRDRTPKATLPQRLRVHMARVGGLEKTGGRQTTRARVV